MSLWEISISQRLTGVHSVAPMNDSIHKPFLDFTVDNGFSSFSSSSVLHLHIKFDADIFIQSRVVDILPKLKMAAAAILDFQVMNIWPFQRVDSVAFVFCTKFCSNITEIDALMLKTFI